VSAITRSPRARARSAARSTFGLAPLVLIASSTSPAAPCASIQRAKPSS